jgi:putative ABC transport system ATP-binding protein
VSPVVPASAAEAVFGFDDVGVRVGARHILRSIDLAVAGRGITVILGPSGSGKSMLTRLTNRLLDPSSGTVSFRGTDVRRLDVLELRRRVGMVFQRPTLFDGSVHDNLAATGVRDDVAYAEILRRVGLGDSVLGRDSSTLSGGEAQRVCLARALLMQPKVLVADEPTASLDHASTLVLERLARGLADSGVPVLWVTHDLAQAERIADHRVTLDDGRVVSA